MVAIKQDMSLNSGAARLIIYPTSTQTPIFFAPFAPRKVTYSGGEGTYNEVARPARKPLLSRSGIALRKISMELFVGSELYDESVDTDLLILEALASSELPLTIEYDPRTVGQWHITSLSYDSDQRMADDDSITRAMATVEFTQVVDNATLSSTYIGMNRPKKYRPQQGDSLRSIALTYYGTASPTILQAIAKANDIKVDIRRLPTSIRLP